MPYRYPPEFRRKAPGLLAAETSVAWIADDPGAIE